MKILFVCQYYYPENFMINSITSALAKKGHQVSVLTGLPNYPKGKIDNKYKWFKRRHENINNVEIIRSSLIARRNSKLGLFLNYLSFMITSSFKCLFIKKDFDLIIAYQLSPITMVVPAIILKKMTKKKLVLYCFDLWPESVVSGGIENSSRLYKILLEFSRCIYNQADKILISSLSFRKYFNEILKISDDIEYLPIYADDLFTKIENEPISSDNLNVLFAGNIGIAQSIETIILAAKELEMSSNLIFHIVGDGSALESAKKLAKRLKLKNVIFYGRHSLEKMKEFYSMADICLVTLRSNKNINYTLPGKVQTYMAAGKVIIGAAEGETKLVIEESKAGLCGKADDPIELAENILEISKSKELKYEMEMNSKLYYNKYFSKEIFFSNFDKLLNDEE